MSRILNSLNLVGPLSQPRAGSLHWGKGVGLSPCFIFVPPSPASPCPQFQGCCLSGSQSVSPGEEGIRGRSTMLHSCSLRPALVCFLETPPGRPLATGWPATFHSPSTCRYAGFYLSRVTSIGIPLFSRKVIPLRRIHLKMTQACVFLKIRQALGKTHASTPQPVETLIRLPGAVPLGLLWWWAIVLPCREGAGIGWWRPTTTPKLTSSWPPDFADSSSLSLSWEGSPTPKESLQSSLLLS